MSGLVHSRLRPTRGARKGLPGGDRDNGNHCDDNWDIIDEKSLDEEDDSCVQEKDLILSSRSFDPVKSEQLLSGNVFLLLRDMLKNK